jgi:hypothetical protein
VEGDEATAGDALPHRVGGVVGDYWDHRHRPAVERVAVDHQLIADARYAVAAST